MVDRIRDIILERCKDGEQLSRHKSEIEWKLGKLLSYGVTPNGFPFVVWETTNFASISLGKSREGVSPVSYLRNDICGRLLNTQSDRIRSATKMSMSKEIIY